MILWPTKERKEMSGNKYVLDTNIISYFISGNEDLAFYFIETDLYISFITELELLANPYFSIADLEVLQGILSTIRIIEINPVIKTQTVYYRKNFKLNLPDSIIAATPDLLQYPLVTADKQFIKIPLKIEYYQYTP